ncbi:uncharacterized protein MONBRDRAFT_32571 [Monosiga brevicollis MX1]|uniref:MI domain-containing protein n=1 Tax=Monosiga brevicollis TaxID=81824 RepID=A9V0D8_MONBE|nr:uncharacterized protein MONBRDRAFT_32571 [Monosiga brevicollis MX1]EDQ88994.1 predicted protein [Monosiga brevicollis MX1]|eukprot:XP_001746099.1 hypothetical protein [Monosiga brevicollis MX1]
MVSQLVLTLHVLLVCVCWAELSDNRIGCQHILKGGHAMARHYVLTDGRGTAAVQQQQLWSVNGSGVPSSLSAWAGDRVRRPPASNGDARASPARRRSGSRSPRQRSRSRSRSRSPPGRDEDRRRSPGRRSPVRRSPGRRSPGRRSPGRRSPIRRNRNDRDQLVPAEDPQDMARARGKTKSEPNPILTRAGGAYIPPARLRMMQAELKDKNSKEFQRMAWQSLKKSINGLINKVNVPNIQQIVVDLLGANLVRGRGLFARACMKAQAASTTFTHVYAALVAIINTKFPQLGMLILKRLVLQFRKSYRRNDKQVCLNTAKFIAHLVNQQVAHEILALEVMVLLLEKATDDSVEVAIAFLKECGQYLTDVAPRALHNIFERLRSILHEGEVEKRSQYMIEVMFAVRKDGFKDNPIIPEGLDLVEEADQITHTVSLDEEINPETGLDVFKYDPDYELNEERYKEIKAEILGDSDSDGDDEEGSDEEESSDEEQAAPPPQHTGPGGRDQERVRIEDMTETNLIALRRTIYLTLKSSLNFEEAVHKLMKMTFRPGQEGEIANMVIECCAQERSYIKFFGLLAQRFCELNRDFQDKFVEVFAEQYETVHRLETNKLRQEAKLFAHLFFSDAIPWTALSVIHLNERDTTSSSRIFIKELFLEISQFMGLKRLLDRLRDPSLRRAFEGLFPLNDPRDTRFAINFFTTIGLGALTDDMRTHLKNAPKPVLNRTAPSSSSSSSSSSDSDSDSGSSSSSSGSGSSSSSSSSSSSRNDSRRPSPRRAPAPVSAQDVSAPPLSFSTPPIPVSTPPLSFSTPPLSFACQGFQQRRSPPRSPPQRRSPGGGRSPSPKRADRRE